MPFAISMFPAIPRPLYVPLIALTATLMLPPAAGAFQADEEDDGLYRGRPGLVARYSDGRQSIMQPEGRLAFYLARDESPHPRIAPQSFHGTYTGNLLVKQPGKYRFSVDLLGQFSLSLNGETVLSADSKNAAEPVTLTSDPIELPYGPLPLEATFAKTAPAGAVLRLHWQTENGFRQPVSPTVLFHDPPHETEHFRRQRQWETGRDLVESHNCTACHRPATTQPNHPHAPRLDDAGRRFYRNWIYHWLRNPHAFHPHTAMPKLFSDGKADRVDLYALTEYLSSLGGPLHPAEDSSADPWDFRKSQGSHRRAFAETGCIACHTALDETPVQFPQLRSLTGLASKMPRPGITAAITKPQQYHPGSRMPDFRLQQDNAELLNTIVDYVNSDHNEAFEKTPEKPGRPSMIDRYQALVSDANRRATFSDQEESAQWRQLGGVVLETRGCLNCHQLGERKTRLTNLPDFAAIRRNAEAGCLAPDSTPQIPDFQFSKEDRAGIRHFLTEGIPNSAAKAPVYEAERSLRRLGCTACHRRNDKESVFAQRILNFTTLESDQQLRDITPPALTAVGEKLNPDWIHAVVAEGERARPWMKLKMPAFPKSEVAGLSAQLVKADGLPPRSEPPIPPLPIEEELEAGRMLVGKTGFNCVSCHDIRGIQSTGVRGPDLAGVFRRVRREWFERWLLNPQQISLGTRMPTVFFAGRSAAPQYLGGDPQAQIEALWAYLARGEKLKLPLMTAPLIAPIAGGETPRLVPEDRPLLARGYLREHGGHRGIALGFPQGTHFGFDSEHCRLVSAWHGEFLELGGWFGLGRGGAENDYNKVTGNVFWQNAQPLISFGEQEPSNVRYLACWATKEDAGFSYRLKTPGDDWITVEDRPAPLQNTDIPGFIRKLTLKNLHANQAVQLTLLNQTAGRFPEKISTPNSPRHWWRVAQADRRHLISVENSPDFTPKVSKTGLRLLIEGSNSPKTVSVDIIYLQPDKNDVLNLNQLEKNLR